MILKHSKVDRFVQYPFLKKEFILQYSLSILLFTTTPSYAFERITVGPSFSQFETHQTESIHHSLGVEITLDYLKHIGWISGGIWGIDTQNEVTLNPYLEFGVWLGFNLGMGISYFSGIPAKRIHFFVGFPYPLGEIHGPELAGVEKIWHLQPYLRAFHDSQEFHISQKGIRNLRHTEIGIILKAPIHFIH